jgi:hypothetical protein
MGSFKITRRNNRIPTLWPPFQFQVLAELLKIALGVINAASTMFPRVDWSDDDGDDDDVPAEGSPRGEKTRPRERESREAGAFQRQIRSISAGPRKKGRSETRRHSSVARIFPSGARGNPLFRPARPVPCVLLYKLLELMAPHAWALVRPLPRPVERQEQADEDDAREGSTGR